MIEDSLTTFGGEVEGVGVDRKEVARVCGERERLRVFNFWRRRNVVEFVEGCCCCYLCY